MKLIKFVFLLLSTSLFAQDLVPLNGVKESKAKTVVVKNARIFVSPGKIIENGFLVLEGDKIVQVGGTLAIMPKDALILDFSGKTILPAFVEVNSSVGLPKVEGRHSMFPQLESYKSGAYYWNECIHPEVDASLLYNFDERAIEDLHKMGFGLVSTRQNDGLAQGTSVVFSLGLENFNKNLIKIHGPAYFSFNKGISNQTYPSSQMGSIALLRQAFYDAAWYDKAQKKENNLSLEALNLQLKGGLLFQVKDKYEILRAQKIAKEFNLSFTYIASGNEYEVMDDLKKINTSYVLPLNFPDAYNVKDPYISKEISVGDLKQWELAPYNPALFEENKLTFALSAAGLSSQNFWKQVKKAIESGLSVDAALNALTLEPSKILGIDNEFGSLEEGKKASFMVYDSNPFENEAALLEAWILGEQKIYQQQQNIDVRGTYSMVVDDEYFTLEISGEKEKPKAKLKNKVLPQTEDQAPKKGKGKKNPKNETATDSLSLDCFVAINGNDLTLQFTSDQLKWKGSNSLHAKFSEKFGIFEGDALLANGKWVRWSAIRNKEADKDKEDKKKEKTNEDEELKVWYPNMAFGFEEKPKQEVIVFKNVTVWTNEKEGIIHDATVVVENGKIKSVGKGDAVIPKNAKVYDGKGMHLTSGIIDEHSHIAISKGVNESGQAVTSEVSIGDVVKSDDVDIYRQLSGGVTAAQLLHGSANPIGGQSALVKLKWGHTPEEMLIPNAPKFIKFALGENVKQANWGDFNRVRFPQTRMGVEQVMYDAFERAKAYEKEKLANPNAYRKDLELEALLEILKSERFITCHSYVQSEINMLMHVADSMGFRINTFTHILEGYKVADKMKKHGAGGSTFSDWWAYKFEVNDAIPYNAAMMTKLGIVTAINSDDAEMGRRLNQEAAKAIKYGGLSEEEAWKLVTLNPAKLLHLEDRMGSVKVGKDADLVLWTTNPLSVEAVVVATVIDGEILYDKDKNQALEQKNAEEKARIITKMLDENKKGGDTKPFTKKKNKHFHCNTFGEEATEEINVH